MIGLEDILDRSRDALVGAAQGVVSGSNGLLGQLGDTLNGENTGLFDSDTLGLAGAGLEGRGLEMGMDMDIGQYEQLSGLANGFKFIGLDLGDVRKMLLWSAVLAVLLLVAVFTNPTEASFKTHLTELSFRRHLAVIRSNDDHSIDTSSTGPTNAILPIEDKHDSKPISTPSGGTGTETPPIAPFRFSNHVAISLRTPMLYYKTLLFLSIAITSPIGPPAFLADPIHVHTMGKRGAVPREKLVLYLGYLGYWVHVGIIPKKAEWVWKLITEGPREKGKRKGLAERAGISELRAMPGKEETPTTTSSKGAIPLNPTKVGKLLRHAGSTNELNDNSTLPIHSMPTIPIPTQSESRRPSLVNLLPPSNAPSDSADTPILLSLKSDLAKAQDTLSDLKNQLLSHEQTVSDAHSSLQTTLDDLRNKRKDDDVERQELKGRTKSLEEQKRQAESARKEAEKKLKLAESSRDGLIGKIEGAIKEIGDMKLSIESSEKAVRVMTEEGARFVVETREAVESRKLELVGIEEEIVHIDSEQEELGGKVKEAEERLRATREEMEAAKKMGPEEEMMMMAAAYEAAAQEGYMYGQGQQPQGTHNQHGPHGHAHSHNGHHTPVPHPGGHQHTANWASQAAAYMAEAGMPLLDQSYTARSTSTNRVPADMKRLADLSGFEDFGPGANHNNIAASRKSSGDGFGQILGNAASRLHPHTPPGEDYASESDIYGMDPGSPNGGISTSFSANLLPQGLFRSLLGGDATPVDDEAGSTLSEALNFEPPPIVLSPTHETIPGQVVEEDHDHSGSESGDEAEDIWKSPMTENHLPVDLTNPAVNNPTTRSKRFSFAKLLPPTNSTPPAAISSGTPAVLAGLPAFPPGSRRWFSGTNSASAENLNNFQMFHTTGSSDSLNHNPPSSLGLGNDSPFAPSKKEKEQLALKWGPLSKYRWASPSGSASRDPDGPGPVGGASGGSPLGRSASLELNHARGTSAPAGGSSSPQPINTLQGQSWMARHLHVNGNGNVSPSLPSSPTTATPSSMFNKANNKSPLIPHNNRHSTDLYNDDELEENSLISGMGLSSSSSVQQLGTSAESGNSKDDKKSFKFFSLRKPAA